MISSFYEQQSNKQINTYTYKVMSSQLTLMEIDRLAKHAILQEELLAENMNLKPYIYGDKWKNGMVLWFLKAQDNLSRPGDSQRGTTRREIAQEMNRQGLLHKPKIIRKWSRWGVRFISSSTRSDLIQAIRACRSPIFFKNGMPLMTMDADKKRENIIFSLLKSNIAKDQHWVISDDTMTGTTMYFLPPPPPILTSPTPTQHIPPIHPSEPSHRNSPRNSPLTLSPVSQFSDSETGSSPSFSSFSSSLTPDNSVPRYNPQWLIPAIPAIPAIHMSPCRGATCINCNHQFLLSNSYRGNTIKAKCSRCRQMQSGPRQRTGQGNEHWPTKIH